MPIEFENHLLTGPIDNPGDGLFELKHPPITGLQGEWSLIVDPVHGPAQKEGKDWGLTGINISYNLDGSSIKQVRQQNIEEGGLSSEGPTVRVIYDYE
jgi:hypothetical protein